MTEERNNGTLGVLVATGVVVALCAALGAWVLRGSASPSGDGSGSGGDDYGEIPAEALATMVLPDFEQVDQDGQSRSKDAMRGRVTLLAFSFANCPTVCPIMHSMLLQAQNETLAGSNVQIVTVSVDPKHDTPDALREYGARLGVDWARWMMLTSSDGGDATVRAMVRSLRFAIADDPSLTVTLPSGETMSNINHPSKILLIGPEATVVGMGSGLEWNSLNRLARRAVEMALQYKN